MIFLDLKNFMYNLILTFKEISRDNLNSEINLYDLNRQNEAINFFIEAIRLDPKNAKAHYYKGMFLIYFNRNKQEALESFMEAMRLDTF